MPRSLVRSRGLAVAGVAAAVLVGVAALGWWRSHNVGPVQRGAELATRHGCLSCHGSAGRPEDPHPLGTGGAPSFSHDDVAEYARDEDELREWILDGRPRRLREDRDDPPPLLAMPAFRKVLGEVEVGHLVAWVKAVSDFGAVPERAAAGRDLARRLGCFGCHGPQGRGDTPNPGSLKGYIPAWSGADFPELVRSDDELREWIRDGGPRRLRDNPVAAFFLRRQLIRMPAFGDRVSDAEIRDIGAYIRWLRAEAARPDVTESEASR